MKKIIDRRIFALVAGSGRRRSGGPGRRPQRPSFPCLTTSAGQSNDVNTVNIVMEEADIKYDYCDVPTVEMLQAGVGLAGKTVRRGLPRRSHDRPGQIPQGHAL